MDEELQGIQVRLTQFGRAMDELGVSIIKAYSPQAKGRIERLWGTLQSRLPVEFKVHGINNIDAANAFLSKFVDRYNERFAVEPEDPESAFNEPDPGLDLDTILCTKNQRVLINGSTFSYGGKYFQLKNTIKTSTSHKAKITVLESPVTGIRALYAGRVYETQALEERPKVKGTQKNQKPSKERKRLSPAPDHPWRLSIKERPKLNYESRTEKSSSCWSNCSTLHEPGHKHKNTFL